MGRCINTPKNPTMALPVLPTTIPVIHVVVDHVVSQHPLWLTVVDWLGVNWLTGFLGLATLFLGIAALATIVANDLGQQERLVPLVDLADVSIIVRRTSNDYEAVISFDLVNDGGGPAKEVRLTLVRYGDQEVGVDNYLGSISPGQRRRYDEQPFKLPHLILGSSKKPSVLVVKYKWLRPGDGEVYIHMDFPDGVLPADWRPRTTQPRVVARGPKWLLWTMTRMGM